MAVMIMAPIPTPLNLGWIFQTETAPRPENWPRQDSKMHMGTPQKVKKIRYGIKNVNPPCLKHKYGKRHKLPKPTP